VRRRRCAGLVEQRDQLLYLVQRAGHGGGAQGFVGRVGQFAALSEQADKGGHLIQWPGGGGGPQHGAGRFAVAGRYGLVAVDGGILFCCRVGIM